MNWFRRGKKLLGVAEGLPGNVWGDPMSLLSTAGLCKQQVSMRDHRGRREVARRGVAKRPPLWGRSPLPWVAKQLFLGELEAPPILGREATFTVGRATPELLKGFLSGYVWRVLIRLLPIAGVC